MAMIVCIMPASWMFGLPPFQTKRSDRADVVFSSDFESSDWYKKWGIEKPEPGTDTIAEDRALGFEPLQGKALRVRIGQGGNLGSNLRFAFAKRTGSEPEEIYFRYHLRFANDWDPTIQGGKLPGISGTYNRAGWGGRRVNGRDGWSARGSFEKQHNGETPIGFYCYHVDMQGKYGSIWTWDRDRLGYLQNNRWYAVEQYVKLNSPGRNDGIVRAWIDGKPAFEKTDVRMRDINDLKIEMVWLNVYQGGTKPAPSDDHLYIDNVVISRSYIGPAVTRKYSRKKAVEISATSARQLSLWGTPRIFPGEIVHRFPLSAA
jgi:hypothetical protein